MATSEERRITENYFRAHGAAWDEVADGVTFQYEGNLPKDEADEFRAAVEWDDGEDG